LAPPLPICHLNGEYLPLAEARISPLDRGFLYADGVYEVVPVYAGRPFRYREHLHRLANSLTALQMRNPHDDAGWRRLFATLIERNGAGDLYVYLQVTRGAENGRNHAPLPNHLSPTVFAFCAPWPVKPAQRLALGMACVTAEDPRWARCDIKSVALLPNILLRQLAVDADAGETILLKGGRLTEASASAVHVVRQGELLTPARSQRLLPGTTRSAVEELARSCAIPCRDAAISEADLRGADEILLSAATREIDAVTQLDGKPVGSGKPGPVTLRLQQAFADLKAQLRNTAW
jgi:D-alanine transaminase